MKTEIFDRETILDLVVNFIPLGIILFFVGLYLVRRPWGFDLFGLSGVMLALLVVPFLALAVLTYLSAVAIAGDEESHATYAQGQAGLRGATPLHEKEDEETADDDDAEPEDAEADEGDDIEAPVDDETDSETDDEETSDDSESGDDDTAADETDDESSDDDTKPDEN